MGCFNSKEDKSGKTIDEKNAPIDAEDPAYGEKANGTKPAQTTGDEDLSDVKAMDEEDDKSNESALKKDPQLARALEKINELRARHAVPNLIWSDKLYSHAQNWAEHLSTTGALSHSDCNDMGENVYYRMDSTKASLIPEIAVETWYNEMKNYDFSSDQDQFANVGHFTQLVWKSSKEVGIGYIVKEDEMYLCGNFTPAGNVRGQYQENVRPPQA